MRCLTNVSLGLMCLTLLHAIQSWRMTNGRLYTILVKSNIFYYSCSLCESKHTYCHPSFHAQTMILVSEVLSAVNVFTSRYLHVRKPLMHCMTKTLIFRIPSTSTTSCSKSMHIQICLCIHTDNTSYQSIILAILALRMHLHIWQIDQQSHNIDALVWTSLSDI